MSLKELNKWGQSVDNFFKEYIKGKRVCFVGACPNIQGMGKGKEIDNFDIVVKTNGSVFFDKDKYYKDYGRRIDVLYTNVQFAREMRPFPCKTFVKKGVKWLCMKTLDKKDDETYSKYINVRSLRRVIKDVHSQVYGALMGAFIITDLIKANPKELYLTGIDFFISKNKVFKHDDYSEYLDGYLPDKIRRQGNIINKGKTEDGHNILENTKYIYDLFKKYDNLKTDDFIYELMKNIVSGKVIQK
jgi:hypothetical protein